MAGVRKASFPAPARIGNGHRFQGNCPVPD